MSDFKAPAVRLLSALLLLLLPGAAYAQPLLDPLDPITQPKFVNPLPNPLDNVLVPDPQLYPGTDFYHVTTTQVRQRLGLVDPATGKPLETTVWGYDGRFPGPTFEARTGQPVKVLFTNDLQDKNGAPLPHLLPLDTTLDCGPLDVFGNPSFCRPFVRTAPHLHGARVDADNSGHPAAWFAAGFKITGPRFTREVYDYANDQEAATLWYHDGAQGIARLNVYAGLAGFYLLRDSRELQLQKAGILPVYPYEVPLILQDRSFHADGSLAYPNAPFLDEKGNPASLDPLTGLPVPSIVPETFGDVILVNGVAWPYLEVEPRPYRFRVLNGSDSRFYALSVSGLSKFAVVGGDGGLLEQVTWVNRLVLAPGERADVVLDLSTALGKTLTLINTAAAPYPDGTAPDPRTTGKILQLRIKKGVVPVPWVKLPAGFQLRPPIAWPEPTVGLPPREALLLEGEDAMGREMPQLGLPELGGMRYADPATETPLVGTTEIWSLLNASEYSYPVHLHGMQVQVRERQKFDLEAYVPGKPDTLIFLAKPVPPLPVELGWKDTVQTAPGMVTRIAVRFGFAGDYVWDCTILSHTDHEMMRPLVVLPPTP